MLFTQKSFKEESIATEFDIDPSVIPMSGVSLKKPPLVPHVLTNKSTKNSKVAMNEKISRKNSTPIFKLWSNQNLEKVTDL